MKDEQEVIEKAIELINNSMAGFEKESPKIDYKLEWSDLKSKYGLNEFCKDVSSIANTVGLDGYIIYGLDDRAKKLKNAKFEDCGLRDTSDLNGILGKKLSNLFQFQIVEFEHLDNLFSIFHIPPTFNKPIVIKCYQKFDKNNVHKGDKFHEIFVRKNTGTFEATKYDIDFMYYDNKNIVPDYDLRIDCVELKFYNTGGDSKNIVFHPNFSIENLGKRPVALHNIKFRIIYNEEETDFVLGKRLIEELAMRRKGEKAIIIKSNDIIFISELHFKIPGFIKKEEAHELSKSHIFAVLTLTNSRELVIKVND